MKRDIVTVRLTKRTNIAINIVVSKLQVSQPDRRVTQDDAVWHLIEKADPETAQLVEREQEKFKTAANQ